MILKLKLSRLSLPLIILLSSCATYSRAPIAVDSGLVRPILTDAAQMKPINHPRLPAAALNVEQPLDELDVARLALLLNPDLAAQRQQVGVAEAQLFSAGLLPDPQLSFSLDKPYSPGLVNALSGSFGVELGSLLTRPAAKAASTHNLEKVRLDVAWSEWLTINQARTLCRRVHYLEQQLDIAEQSTVATKKIYDLSAANKRRGDAKLDETTIYQVGFIDAQDRSLSLKRNLAATRLQLNALLGLAPTDTLKLAPPSAILAADKFNADQLTQTALNQRFDLQALREGYLSQESELRRAVATSIPLPQLSWNRARDTSSVWTRGPGIGFSLPLWNRGRGDIHIAAATRSQMAAEYQARVYQTRIDIAGAQFDLTALQAQRSAITTEIPSLITAANVLDKAAREGNVTLLTSETVRVSLLDKQLALSALEQAQAEGEVALETAVGDWLPDTNSLQQEKH